MLRGLVVVSKDMSVGQAVDELVLIFECTQAEDWLGRIGYLPL